MAELQGRVAVEEPILGELRLDILSSRVIRVRYAERGAVPENQTAMLEGELEPGSLPEFETTSAAVAIRTEHLHWRVELSPFRMVAMNGNGGLLTEVGGKEKNFFGKWDSLNTGLIHNDEQLLATENFSLAPGEAVYGFGEKFIKLDKTGQTIDLDTDDAMGVMTPRSYKNVPFYVTTGG